MFYSSKFTLLQKETIFINISWVDFTNKKREWNECDDKNLLTHKFFFTVLSENLCVVERGKRPMENLELHFRFIDFSGELVRDVILVLFMFVLENVI